MASLRSTDDTPFFSSDQGRDDHYSRAWKMSENLLHLRIAGVMKSIHDLELELKDTVRFLKKVFVDREFELPIMEASIRSIITSANPAIEALTQEGRLIVQITASGHGPVDSLQSYDPPISVRPLDISRTHQ